MCEDGRKADYDCCSTFFFFFSPFFLQITPFFFMMPEQILNSILSHNSYLRNNSNELNFFVSHVWRSSTFFFSMSFNWCGKMSTIFIFFFFNSFSTTFNIPQWQISSNFQIFFNYFFLHFFFVCCLRLTTKNSHLHWFSLDIYFFRKSLTSQEENLENGKKLLNSKSFSLYS